LGIFGVNSRRVGGINHQKEIIKLMEGESPALPIYISKKKRPKNPPTKLEKP